MATSIVDSLFGPQPWQIQRAENKGLQDFAHQQAQMNAAQRGVQGMVTAGGMFGQAGMEGAGYVNPAVAEAQTREAVMGMGGDLTTPYGLRLKAKQFQESGDGRIALKLAIAANEMEKSLALSSKYSSDGLGIGKIEDPNRVANRNWSQWLDSPAGLSSTLDQKEVMKEWFISEAQKDFKNSVAMLQRQPGLAGVKPPVVGVTPPVASPQPVAPMPPVASMRAPIQSAPVAAPVAPPVAPPVARSTPTDFPRVSPTTQLARDKDRLAILKKEIETYPNDFALAKDLEDTSKSIARQEKLLSIPSSSDAKATTEGKVVTARVESENNPDALRRGAAATAEGKVVGEAGGKASVSLAGSDEIVKEVKENINELLTHKGFKNAVGATLLPGMRFIEGSNEASFMVRLEQIQGGAFLRAYETLKGGGQITEIEGQKATAAMSRMSKSTSEKEFKLAALDFVQAITIGLNKLKAQEALMKKAQSTKPTSPTSLENQLAPPPGFKR